MGTTFAVKIVAPRDSISTSDLQADLQQALDSIEQLTSTYIEQSELSVFNSNASTDWISVSLQLCHTVARALVLAERTDGAFDITVGPLVNLWGFGPNGERTEPPSDTDIVELLKQVGFEKIETDCERPALRKQHPQLFVDLSGWAKGFAADQLATVLIEGGMQNFLVEVGGEMRVQGSNAEGKPWAVAIEKPITDGREVQSILRLSNTGLATSGDYRNYFQHDGQRYSHTIDPRNGKPISHQLASVTVFDDSAADADGLATALLVLGPEQGPALAGRLGIDALFILRTPTGFDAVRTTTTN
jgi:thiamine biosynthesis lipoprotein